jgi:hypothetical protein
MSAGGPTRPQIGPAGADAAAEIGAAERHTGGCVCGRVRFEAAGAPAWACYSHCTECRGATGAPVTLWVGFPAVRVTWIGERTVRPGVGAVGRGIVGGCGAPVSYADATIPGDEVYLAIGAVDEPGRIAPEAHAFWASRLPFVAFHDALPKYPTFSRRRVGAIETKRAC